MPLVWLPGQVLGRSREHPSWKSFLCLQGELWRLRLHRAWGRRVTRPAFPLFQPLMVRFQAALKNYLNRQIEKLNLELQELVRIDWSRLPRRRPVRLRRAVRLHR